MMEYSLNPYQLNDRMTVLREMTKIEKKTYEEQETKIPYLIGFRPGFVYNLSKYVMEESLY